MKKHEFFLLFLLAFFSLIVSSCGKFNSWPAEPHHEEASALPVSATQAFTNMPVSSPTTITTLPAEDARKKMLELLANNGNCRLPCLWGITPGKSTYQEAQAILMQLNSVSILTGFIAQGGSIAPQYNENDLVLSTTVGFNVEPGSNNQIVSYLGFEAGEFKEDRTPIYGSKTFGERLHLYMLPGILSEFGKPTSMAIHTYGKEITGTGGFEIVLVYPEQGILVHYVTQMQAVGLNVRGCLANAHAELRLYPSDDGDSFVKSLSKTFWAPFVKREPITDLNWKAHWKPVDEATSMSLDQFYETFRQPTDKCIETPINLWPLPEQ